MCVIAYGKIEAIRPHIQKMMFSNDDGAGYAWTPDNKTIRYEKGLMSLSKVEQKLSAIDDGADILFHARIATHGGRSLLLTHPFPINGSTDLKFEGSAKSVLAHNGIWTQYLHFNEALPLKSGPWSDTRVMAYLLGTGIFGEKILRYSGGSWIIMYPDKAPLMVGRWVVEDGVYYSNLLWKFPRIVQPSEAKVYSYGRHLPYYGADEPAYSARYDRIQKWDKLSDVVGDDVATECATNSAGFKPGDSPSADAPGEPLAKSGESAHQLKLKIEEEEAEKMYYDVYNDRIRLVP